MIERSRRRIGRVLVALLSWSCSCADDDASGEAVHSARQASLSSPCEGWAAIGDALGCAARGCRVAPECEDAAHAWLDCVMADLAQCRCESDEDLNCEGSFKEDEGPARCKVEARALRRCQGDVAGAATETDESGGRAPDRSQP